MERRPKTIYNVDTPYSADLWPQITPENQESVLELLCSLLTPIAHHRTQHITPSTGKRDKKRKRKEIASASSCVGDGHQSTLEKAPQRPQPPSLASHLTIGFNSTTRHLEALSQMSNPFPKVLGSEERGTNSPVRHLAAVYVPRSSQPAALHAHLPLLIYTASLANPSLPPTRLVNLPKGAEARLCTALGLPRVNFIGIMDGAPHAGPLIDYVRQHVSVIDVPWLREAARGEYKPLQVTAVHTTMPVNQKAKGGLGLPKKKQNPNPKGDQEQMKPAKSQ